MTDFTALWDTLGKTDPKHTKPFNRAGGFKGTAIKPQWVMMRLTEQFGPCGVGWGVNKPEFQVVNGDKETLVYCTVSAWHGKPDQVIWGVGGDKVVTARSSGPFCDDEAFKKSFTDAIMNAFKFIGVAADVHLGRFDDSKYVSEMEGEFAPPPTTSPAADFAIATMRTNKTADEFKAFWEANKDGLKAQLTTPEYARVLVAMREEAARLAPPKTDNPFTEQKAA